MKEKTSFIRVSIANAIPSELVKIISSWTIVQFPIELIIRQITEKIHYATVYVEDVIIIII